MVPDNIKCDSEKKKLILQYREKLDYQIRNNDIKDIYTFLNENMEIIKFDNDLMTVWYLGLIVNKEMNAGIKTIFEKEDSLESLMERYRRLKFFLRRIENGILEDKDEFYSFLAGCNVSEYELMGVVDGSVFNKEKVWQFFR